MILLVYKEIYFNSNVVISLLQDFDDIFSKDILNRLPPLRGMEQHIDLVPRVAIPNKPTYRSNPEKTKEFQKKVDELMMKGYIHASMSLYDVLVFCA